VLRAIGYADHGPPRSGIRKVGFEVLAGHPAGVPHQATRDHLPLVGTGAWEAAIVTRWRPGDKVLMAETGQFAVLLARHRRQVQARRRFHSGRLASRRDIEQIEARLSADHQHKIKAVMIVHNETSTGCVTYPLDVARFSTTPASWLLIGRHHFRPRFAGI